MAVLNVDFYAGPNQERAGCSTGGLNQERLGCSTWSDDDQRLTFRRDDSTNRSLNTLLSAKYTFTVPWTSLPSSTLDTLTANEALNERASPSDESTIRLAIAKKLKADYKAFKESHPGQQKHPGMIIYKSVAKQVISIGKIKINISCH